MRESLSRLVRKQQEFFGASVTEVIYSEAMIPGQWVCVHGSILVAAPDLEADISALWPDLRVEKPNGVMTGKWS